VKGKSALLLLCGLALGILFGMIILWESGTFSKIKDSFQNGPIVGRPAPDFELSDLNGNPVRLSQYKGHPVTLNFWATWCEPCKLEMPLLEAYQKKYSPDLVVLGVNSGEGKVVVKLFLDKNEIAFPIVLDETSRIGPIYQVTGYPTSFFIDRNGILRSEHIGQVTEDLLIRYLETIGIK
jgi:thiol-disulfide isomerase/thioredoxin